MRIEEDPPENFEKRPIVFRVDENGIHIEQGLDINALPKNQILAFKPKGADFSDDEWLLTTGFFGIAGACGKVFIQFLDKEHESDRVPVIPPAKIAPGMWERIILGEAGELGYKATGGDFDKLTEFMAEHEWKTEQLGVFGQWITQAGIAPRLIRPILQSYLKD